MRGGKRETRETIGTREGHQRETVYGDKGQIRERQGRDKMDESRSQEGDHTVERQEGDRKGKRGRLFNNSHSVTAPKWFISPPPICILHTYRDRLHYGFVLICFPLPPYIRHGYHLDIGYRMVSWLSPRYRLQDGFWLSVSPHPPYMCSMAIT